MLIFSVVVLADSADIDTLFSRLRESYLAKQSHDSALILMRSQVKDGSWKKFNYDFEQSRWPSKHLNNLKSMSKYYEMYPAQKDSLRVAIIRGLEFWFKRQAGYVYDNWWVNEIGIQRDLNRIAIILWNDLPKELQSKIIEINQEEPSGYGANRAWISENIIIRGILEKRENQISLGLKNIITSILITDQEGHQEDHSYFMHGRLLYNGGYGKISLSIVAFWASITKGTKFALSERTIENTASLALEGTRWMMWGSMVDAMVLGREISRKGGNIYSKPFLSIINNLSKVDTLNHEAYNAWASNIKMESLDDIVGCRYFWRGEMMVCRSPSFYVSLKMSSSNTVGSETLNRENTQGYWLGMGVLSIYQHPDDFENIYPLWDWSMLPGITSYNVTQQKEKRVTNLSNFVGGVSDKEYGVASMIFSRPNIIGNKTWFFGDDFIIALGSGITGMDKSEIKTTIDQRLVHTEMYTERGAFDSKQKHQRLWHDSIGYVNLDDNGFYINKQLKTESWKKIGPEKKEESAEVLKIWKSHGRNPKHASYSYLVDLNVDQVLFFKKNYDDIKIIQNDSSFQVVYNHKNHILGGTFYTRGVISIDSMTIESSSPCVFLLRKMDKAYKLIIADPEKKNEQIHFRISKNKQNGKKSFVDLQINMPQERLLGSPKAIDFIL